MNKFKTIALATAVLALFTVLLVEHRSRTALREEMRTLKSEMDRLATQVIAGRQERTGPQAVQPRAAIPPDQTAELLALRAQISDLRRRLAGL